MSPKQVKSTDFVYISGRNTLAKFADHICMTVFDNDEYQVFYTDDCNAVYVKKEKKVYTLEIDAWTKMVLKLEKVVNTDTYDHTQSIWRNDDRKKKQEEIGYGGAADHPIIYNFPDHKTVKKVIIDRYFVEPFLALRKLPADIKMEIMHFTIEEIEKLLSIKRSTFHKTIADLFKEEWLDKENGYPVTFDVSFNELCFGEPYSTDMILKRIKAKKLSSEQMQRIVDWFANEDNVYLQRNRQHDEA